MRIHVFVTASAILLLAACAEPAAEEPAADSDSSGLETLAAGTGPYLVTNADGSMSLTYAAADGSEWGGPIELTAGQEPVRWGVTDGQVCITFPETMEDAEDFCIAHGELQEDGSWAANNANMPDEPPTTFRRLDTAAVSEADQISAGTYWVDMADGNSALVVWAEDGTSYLAMNPTAATWRAEGTRRCTTPEGGEENCGEPTSEMGDDGSFTAEDGANGSITVRML